MVEHTVLVIGGGGREHALCWKLSESTHVKQIFVTPENPGSSKLEKVTFVPLNVKDNEEIAKWSKKQGISMVVIGPEDPLANGLADELRKVGISCFGPEQRAAKIETDKNWAKEFMNRHNIPTARWKGFTEANEAKKFIHESEFPALVVKAAGLAAGKGVVVASTKVEACEAVDQILVQKKFGSAGQVVVVEELLEGEEVSMLAFTDGKTVVPLLPAQDHKRIFNGDLGLNTGGMGAYCPCPLLSDEDLKIVETNVLQKTVDGLRNENIPFVGVLYAGLMLTKNGPMVLEFNCRFGDPETQVILPLLKSDLFLAMKSCCDGTLQKSHVSWRQDLSAVGVVLASRGYPETSSKGQVITGVDEVAVRANHVVFHSGTKVSPTGDLLTNGGRVLIAVSLAPTLAEAAARSTAAAKTISFDGKQFRTDIAHKGIARSILRGGKMSYKFSGVDIEAGDSLVSVIKPVVSATHRSGALGQIGGFGGLFDTKSAGYKDPILVSGTDGVGTKLKIAIQCNKHDTIGIDLVAMCVNDVLAHGAEPLFFLDYFACGKLDLGTAAKVVCGVAEGCRRAGCTLVGGETAEMPDMYAAGEYDLAGFSVGAVERNELLPRTNEVQPGDVVIGLPSSGVHSNGFSLVRTVLKLANKTVFDVAPFSQTGKTIGEELLEPTKIYVKGVLPALRSGLVKAYAHITGGGLVDNIPRVLPKHTGVRLVATDWDILPVFSWMAIAGNIGATEMLRTFNCGIGAVIISSPDNANKVFELLRGESPKIIGVVTSHSEDQPRVQVDRFEEAMDSKMRPHVPSIVSALEKPPKRVGVLISGSGTNLQALIDATLDPTQCIGAEIVLVISNKPGVEGLKRAERAGIKTKVVQHTDYDSRESFDRAMDAELRAERVDLICLAGFMRLLSAEFVKSWKGALLNVHPSLLPAFKGAHAHKDALAAGVKVSGCTVHFVEVDVDSGAIIAQEAVPVLPGDTESTLQERVKIAEHRLFPRALKLLAAGKIQLDKTGAIRWEQ